MFPFGTKPAEWYVLEREGRATQPAEPTAQ